MSGFARDTKRILRRSFRWSVAASVGLYFGELGGGLVRDVGPFWAVGVVFVVWVVLAVIIVGLGSLRWQRGRRSGTGACDEEIDTRRSRWESWLRSSYPGELVETSATAAIVGLAATAPVVEGAYWRIFASLLVVGAIVAVACGLWELSPALAQRIRAGDSSNGESGNRSHESV